VELEDCRNAEKPNDAPGVFVWITFEVTSSVFLEKATRYGPCFVKLIRLNSEGLAHDAVLRIVGYR